MIYSSLLDLTQDGACLAGFPLINDIATCTLLISSGLPVGFFGALDEAEEGCIGFNLATLLMNYSDKARYDERLTYFDD